MASNSLSQFRFIAILEGISTLALFLVAMPLKYVFDMPLAVKYTGWAHGLLFISYIIWLVIVSLNRKWGFVKIVLAAAASLVPFGTFILDAKILKPEAQAE